MARFRFEYTETNIGFIEVEADNEDDARDLIECGEGDTFINKSETEVGELIEQHSHNATATLDSGYWHGNDAWVLYNDGSNVTILIGGHSLSEALKVKKLVDNCQPLGNYLDYVVFTDIEEWLEQQED